MQVIQHRKTIGAPILAQIIAILTPVDSPPLPLEPRYRKNQFILTSFHRLLKIETLLKSNQIENIPYRIGDPWNGCSYLLF